MRSFIYALVAAGAANMCLADVPPPNTPNLPKNDGAVLAVWTQFVANNDLTKPNSAIEVRYVLRGDAALKCDSISVMEDGVANTAIYLRGQMSEADPSSAPTPDDYTVQVCGALLGANTRSVSLKNGANVAMVYNGSDPMVKAENLPGPAMLGARAMGEIKGIAMADSGCRGAGDGQNCATDWVLKELSQDALKHSPDFVLHGGDYHYFYETDSTFWGPQHGGNRFGYWLQEFFVPAGDLLRAAPWMLGRGNHERCSGQWVGNAWHILFDPRPLTSNTPCSIPDTPNGIAGVPTTWAIDLAPKDGSSPSFRFFVIDNVNAGKVNGTGYADAANAGALADGAQVGWISHYPPIKMAGYQSHGKYWHYGEKAVKQDITAAFGAGASPCVLDQPCIPSLVFTGHQHFFQEFEFDNKNIPVIAVIGHGGVAIGPNQQPGYPTHLASSCRRDFSKHMPFIGAGDATVNTAQFHGYMVIKRDSSTMDRTGWDRSYEWLGANVDFFDIGACPHN